MPGRDGTGSMGADAFSERGIGCCSGRGFGRGVSRGFGGGIFSTTQKALLSERKERLQKRLDAINRQLNQY